MKTLRAFDFDGTITTRDTFLAFLRFATGRRQFFARMAKNAPNIAKMFLHLTSTQKAKEAVFAHFFKGLPLSDFNLLCRSFAEKNSRLLRKSAIEAIRSAIETGDNVLIVSASIENYIAPFFEDLPITIEATKVETDGEGRLTGKFLGKNCKGAEKVRRILACFPDRDTYRLIAYGDSKGDCEMLKLADEAHYKPFRNAIDIAEKMRYLLTGGIAVAVQYALYRILLIFFGATISYTLSFLASLAVNFVLSAFFTFRIKPSPQRALGFCLAHAVNYVMQTVLLQICIKIGIHKNLAPIPVYAVCVPLNFFLVKSFLQYRAEELL